MRDPTLLAADSRVWGPYAAYDEVARFEYGRRLWRDPALRCCLQAHWLDQRHPHCERFRAHRGLIEEVLASTEPATLLDARLRQRGTSLRAVAREIPSVFGQWFRLPPGPARGQDA